MIPDPELNNNPKIKSTTQDTELALTGFSTMDAIRKQLDVLMGANRNGDVREVNRKYYDRDVCRLYLVGLCPHELFQLTVTFFFRFLTPRSSFRASLFF